MHAGVIGPSAVHSDAFDAPTRISWTLILSLPSRWFAIVTSRAQPALEVGGCARDARPFPRADGPCSPSEQSSSTSPAMTWCSPISTLTNSSCPSERLSIWPADESAACWPRELPCAPARWRRCGRGSAAGVAVADEIAARVADVGDGGAIDSAGRRRQRGRHGDAAGLCRRLHGRVVGCLHQARAGARREALRPTASRKPASSVPPAVCEATSPCSCAAHAIGKREQPAMRAGSCCGSGSDWPR